MWRALTLVARPVLQPGLLESVQLVEGLCDPPPGMHDCAEMHDRNILHTGHYWYCRVRRRVATNCGRDLHRDVHHLHGPGLLWHHLGLHSRGSAGIIPLKLHHISSLTSRMRYSIEPNAHFSISCHEQYIKRKNADVACFQRLSKDAKAAVLFRNRMESVDKWMSYRGLPRPLRSRIGNYYAEVQSATYH